MVMALHPSVFLALSALDEFSPHLPLQTSFLFLCACQVFLCVCQVFANPCTLPSPGMLAIHSLSL